MKILNFGLPRSRSSLLVDVLSQNYNLENYFEPYHMVLKNQIYSESNIHDYKNNSWYVLMWEKYCELSNSVTTDLSNKDNFICKIFPLALYNSFRITRENQFDFIFEKTEYLDLIFSHKISMYDSIYVTFRDNYTDYLCSMLQAIKHQEFLYTNKNKNLIKFYTPKNCELQCDNVSMINFALNIKLFEIFRKKLIDIKKTVVLEYNEIPNYLEKNFPGVTSKYIDSKIDYKNKVKNYNQLNDDFSRIIEKVTVNLLS